MCDRTDTKYHEFVGAVAASLCPRHKTDVHTYITTELPITQFHETAVLLRHSSSDPVLFASISADYLDIELEIHLALKNYIYGEENDDKNTMARSAG